MKFYPDEMNKYKEHQKKTPGVYRADYLAWMFIGFFILSFFDLGLLVGLVLTLTL